MVFDFFDPYRRMLYNVLSWYNAQESKMRGGREAGRLKVEGSDGTSKGFQTSIRPPERRGWGQFFETDLNKLKLLLYVCIMERGHR